VQEEAIKRACAVTTEEWDRCWPLVKPFWREVDGKLVNDTQLGVYSECKRQQDARSDKARKAALAKHKHCTSSARGVLAVCPPSPSPSPSPSPLQEQRTEKEPKASKDAESVFLYWQQQTHKPSAKFTPGRKRKVQARLKEGYSVEQLKNAIDGCLASEFHQGKNDSGMVLDDLTLICRDGEHVERFWQDISRKRPNMASTGLRDLDRPLDD
jgi:uncharacterized protein YdaU (DUF1376 family)